MRLDLVHHPSCPEMPLFQVMSPVLPLTLSSSIFLYSNEFLSSITLFSCLLLCADRISSIAVTHTPLYPMLADDLAFTGLDFQVIRISRTGGGILPFCFHGGSIHITWGSGPIVSE